jgi:hypothetical protein
MLSSLRGMAGYRGIRPAGCSNTNPPTVLRSWEDLQTDGEFIAKPAMQMRQTARLTAMSGPLLARSRH